MLDHAKFFRESGIPEEEAVQKGLLERTKGKAGWILGRLATQNTYDNYVNEGISEKEAVEIAKATPNKRTL